MALKEFAASCVSGGEGGRAGPDSANAGGSAFALRGGVEEASRLSISNLFGYIVLFDYSSGCSVSSRASETLSTMRCSQVEGTQPSGQRAPMGCCLIGSLPPTQGEHRFIGCSRTTVLEPLALAWGGGGVVGRAGESCTQALVFGRSCIDHCLPCFRSFGYADQRQH